MALFFVAAVQGLHAVLVIPQERVAGVGELGANLVGAAGDEVAFHQRESISKSFALVLGDGGLRALHRFISDVNLIFLGVFENLIFQRPASGLYFAGHHSKIGFLDFPVFDELHQKVANFLSLRKKEKARRIEIQTMHRIHCLPAVAHDISADTAVHGVLRFTGHVQREEPRGFVHGQKIFVFIKDVHFFDILFRLQHKGTHHIARQEMVRRFFFFAVHFDFLRPQSFHEKRAGPMFLIHQKLVEPPSFVFCVDDKFFHFISFY